MPIGTITPLNGTQSNLLANALNGSTSSLTAALNNAIQSARNDANVQLQQENAFLTEQQRNLDNEQAERFDLRDRAEADRQFLQDATNDFVSNTIALDGNDIRNQQFGFQSQDRSETRDAGFSAAQQEGFRQGNIADNTQINRDRTDSQIGVNNNRNDIANRAADQADTKFLNSQEDREARLNREAEIKTSQDAILAEVEGGEISDDPQILNSQIASLSQGEGAAINAGVISRLQTKLQSVRADGESDFSDAERSRKQLQAIELRNQANVQENPAVADTLIEQAEILEREAGTGNFEIRELPPSKPGEPGEPGEPEVTTGSADDAATIVAERQVAQPTSETTTDGLRTSRVGDRPTVPRLTREDVDNVKQNRADANAILDDTTRTFTSGSIAKLYAMGLPNEGDTMSVIQQGLDTALEAPNSKIADTKLRTAAAEAFLKTFPDTEVTRSKTRMEANASAINGVTSFEDIISKDNWSEFFNKKSDIAAVERTYKFMKKAHDRQNGDTEVDTQEDAEIDALIKTI